MITGTAASLVNLLGFITGVVLYVMLLSMVLSSRPASNQLALLTGLLGFGWNAGAFGGYVLLNLGFVHAAPLLLAGAFSALCFLPSVVVHSALRATEKVTRRGVVSLSCRLRCKVAVPCGEKLFGWRVRLACI